MTIVVLSSAELITVDSVSLLFLLFSCSSFLFNFSSFLFCRRKFLKCNFFISFKRLSSPLFIKRSFSSSFVRYISNCNLISNKCSRRSSPNRFFARNFSISLMEFLKEVKVSSHVDNAFDTYAGCLIFLNSSLTLSMVSANSVSN